jgi:hypothetical protein
MAVPARPRRVSESALIERLAALLLRQAGGQDTPAGVRALLTGEAEPAEVREESDTILHVRGEQGEPLQIHVQLVVPVQAPETRGPWRPVGPDVPEKLAERSDTELAKLSYIVVDEIVEEAVNVSLSRWPEVDERGRLVFADDPPLSVWADASALRRYLERHGFSAAPDEPRALRMGDAFAARARTTKLADLERAGRSPPRPSAWIVPPVFDLRKVARDKAKEAFYAAVSPTLKPSQARAMEAVPLPEAEGP